MPGYCSFTQPQGLCEEAVGQLPSAVGLVRMEGREGASRRQEERKAVG